MIAVTSFLIVVLVGLLIARVATVALIATGLPLEISKFQARSALTGVGFTTGEAENIVGHPVRRRIVFTLMLIGNAGLVSIVASLALTFATSGDSGDALVRLGVVAGGVLAILVLARSRAFERIVTRWITRLLEKWTDLEVRDMVHLMQLTKDYAVSELRVEPGDWLAGKSLIDLQLPDEGVIVLAIQRANGSFLGAPRGTAVVHPHDNLILYGRSPVLSDLDERRNDPSGNAAHVEAVAEHREIKQSEDDAD